MTGTARTEAYLRIVDLRLANLRVADWQLRGGELWAVLGENGAGKSQLGAALSGALPEAVAALRTRPACVECVSFETQQAVYEQDIRDDDSNHLGGGDHGRTAAQVIAQSGCTRGGVEALAASFGAGRLLNRQYRHLSSGEARRVMLLRAIATAPDLLVLDEPFEGLDPASRQTLVEMCQTLTQRGHRLLLLVNRRDDVPGFVTHLAVLRRGALRQQGRRKDVLAALAALGGPTEVSAPVTLPPPPPGDAPHFSPLLQMRDCSVRYGEVLQFRGLNWTLEPGQHTLVVGENGCGKSTLLQLISGDHPQCYVNDIRVMGYRRGSGESIWDIKRHIGLVSPALHRDYRAAASALDVVVSGLFDSVGVYRTVHRSQTALAMAWLALLGMQEQARTPLRSLSYGEQRLLLIARALIKQPPLLILDEPTQGLDDDNRLRVLGFLRSLADLPRTTLLFVSHRHDEHMPLLRNRVEFVRATEAGVRYEARVDHGA